MLNLLNERYAFAQSFEITILAVTMIFVIAKICGIHYDNCTISKVAFWQHFAFLLWALSHLVVISSQFFVDPD